MTDIASLIIKADATSVKNASEELKKFEQQSVKAEQAGAAIGRTIGFAFVAAAGSIALFTRSSINAADAMNDLHIKIGVSFRDLAAYDELARQSGASVQSIAQGFKFLSKYMVEHSDKLRSIGVTAKDSNEAMRQFADVIAGIRDPAIRSALAQEVLGRSATELLPALVGGSAAIDAARESTTEYGKALETVAPLADAFNDKIEQVKTGLKTVGLALAEDLLPPLTRMIDQLLEGKRIFGDFTTALFTAGTMNPFKSWADHAKDLRAELAMLEKSGSSEQALASVRRKLEWAKYNQNQEALALLPPGGYRDEGARLAKPAGRGTSEAAISAMLHNGGDKKSKGQDIVLRNWLWSVDEYHKASQEKRREQVKAEEDAIREMTRSAQEAQRIIADVDPVYKASLAWEQYMELVEKGFLTQEQAAKKYAKEFGEATNEMEMYAKRLSENVQRNLGDVLYDGLNGNFKDISSAFKQMLTRMAADAMAAQLTRAMFGNMASTGQVGGLAGSLMSIGMSLFGGSSGTSMLGSLGGNNMAGSFYASPSGYSFDGGGYTGDGSRSGGIDGKGGFPAILHPNETVVDHAKGGRTGVSINYSSVINIDSRTDQAEVHRLVSGAIRRGNAELVDRLQRSGVLA